MEVMTKYVLQKADGQFYWKDKSVSSKWGFAEEFDKAYLFDSEKGAKTRLDIAGEGARVRKVSIWLSPEENDTIYIPSVWITDETKRGPSKAAWASTEGEYGESYYDADGKEITKEEYEALLGLTRD